MQNQVPLSPARTLNDELRENEESGSLDNWPARRAPATGSEDNAGINKVAQIHPNSGPKSGVVDSDSIQPRSALAAIIRLQSTEIERLALENDRLAEHLEAVNRLIEDEQNQCRNLELQLNDANLRNTAPAPALDVEEIRRATREGMSAEIKPVLTAILDMLESTLAHSAEAVNPAPAEAGGTPARTPAYLTAEAIADFQRLPEILTRPIEELTSGSVTAGVAPDRADNPPAQAPLPEPRLRVPRPSGHKAQPSSAMPSVFAWTNPFS